MRRRAVARLVGATRPRGHWPVAELADAKYAAALAELIELVLGEGSPAYTQYTDQEELVAEVLEQAHLVRGANGGRES